MVKCNRIDVISILEPHLKDYWEGEDETNGIYFDEQYGYAINKVFAVKVEHQDNVSPLFFITKEDDVFEKIKDFYPYQNMNKRPQKRILLFDKPKLSNDELKQLFLVQGRELELNHDFIISNLNTVERYIKNKRERQRTTTCLSLDKNNLKVIIEKESKKGRLIISENMSKVNNATNKLKIPDITINTNSFYYTLKICQNLQSIKIIHTNDKVLFQGLLKKDKKISLVKIVVALVKGRG